MKPANSGILTINGGSSSIKFALYQDGEPLSRILKTDTVNKGLIHENQHTHA